MEFEQDVEVKGIPAYRFTPPRSVLASAAENPDNEGFCMEKVKEKCLGSGVLKVAVCKKGNKSKSESVISFQNQNQSSWIQMQLVSLKAPACSFLIVDSSSKTVTL